MMDESIRPGDHLKKRRKCFCCSPVVYRLLKYVVFFFFALFYFIWVFSIEGQRSAWIENPNRSLLAKICFAIFLEFVFILMAIGVTVLFYLYIALMVVFYTVYAVFWILTFGCFCSPCKKKQ